MFKIATYFDFRGKVVPVSCVSPEQCIVISISAVVAAANVLTYGQLLNKRLYLNRD